MSSAAAPAATQSESVETARWLAYVAGAMAAHSVRHRDEAVVGQDEEAVLVVVADEADVGGPDEARLHRDSVVAKRYF